MKLGPYTDRNIGWIIALVIVLAVVLGWIG